MVNNNCDYIKLKPEKINESKQLKSSKSTIRGKKDTNNNSRNNSNKLLCGKCKCELNSEYAKLYFHLEDFKKRRIYSSTKTFH